MKYFKISFIDLTPPHPPPKKPLIPACMYLVIKQKPLTMYEMQVCFFDTSNPRFYWLWIPLQRSAATWNSLLQKLWSFWSPFSGKKEELGLHLAWFPVSKKDEWPALSYWECPHLWHSVWSQHHGHKQVERERALNVKAILNDSHWTGPTTGP